MSVSRGTKEAFMAKMEAAEKKQSAENIRIQKQAELKAEIAADFDSAVKCLTNEQNKAGMPHTVVFERIWEAFQGIRMARQELSLYTEKLFPDTDQ